MQLFSEHLLVWGNKIIMQRLRPDIYFRKKKVFLLKSVQKMNSTKVKLNKIQQIFTGYASVAWKVFISYNLFLISVCNNITTSYCGHNTNREFANADNLMERLLNPFDQRFN